MSTSYPIFDPIKKGVFSRGTPVSHERRVEEHCSECEVTTPHDYYAAIMGMHFGVGLPFGRKSTMGKLGTRSKWAFCAACGAVTPLDDAAVAVLRKSGALPDREQLSLEEIARKLAVQISQIISDDQLQELSKLGLDPDSDSHKRELLLLAQHALRVAAQQALSEHEAVTLVDYTEQLVRAVYVDMLKYSGESYHAVLAERFSQYDEIITSDLDSASKLQSLGVCFTSTTARAHPELMLWASKMYVGLMKANADLLGKLNEDFDFVP